MKKSIRVKLFMRISTLVIFFVFFSWVLNSQYLEKYYIMQKKNMLIKNSEKIDAIYNGSTEEVDLELETLEHTIGVNITILNEEEGIKYSSSHRIVGLQDFNRKQALLPPNPPPSKRKIKSEIDGKFIFQVQKDERLKRDFLALITNLNNKDTLILRIPLAAISENADIANHFMLFTGIISIILGSIWALIFSRKFTKPILELNSVAQNMANLDFTKRCSIMEENEIGELGNSINHLSNQLDNAISALYEKNQKLTEDIEKERKLEEMRKEFVSSVSHELKTPISLIQGYAEGLKENVIEDEENKNFYCEVIIDEAKKMDKLVKDLLNLSQIESGFFKLERCIFDLSFLIDQLVNKYKGIFEEKEIHLKVERKENIFVRADKIRIEQVLVNFINNAIHHVEYEKNISIKVVSKENKVRVFVFNSGDPIPKDALDKIWQSFYKVDKARTREYGGYGLGLSIVRGIQELHQNDFGVENMEGGVSFWFDVDKE